MESTNSTNSIEIDKSIQPTIPSIDDYEDKPLAINLLARSQDDVELCPQDPITGVSEDVLPAVPAKERYHKWGKSKKKVAFSEPCILCKRSFGITSVAISRCVQCKKRAHTSCCKSNESIACNAPQKNLWYTESEGAMPLIVFINSRSGGQQGKALHRKLVKLIGEQQVFDLSQGGPTKGLLMYKSVKNLRILVAGGDGSVGWVLSYLDKLGYDEYPAVGILPLGTGNDLARSLNWGGGYSNSEPLLPILKQIESARSVSLDRWKVTITTEKETRTIVMNNYFSIGIDASICLSFHNLRNEKPDMFKNRALNKVIYGYYGMVRSNESLKKSITLTIDGEEKVIKSNITGIIILNLQSYSAGADIWGNIPKDKAKKFKFVKPTFHDGLVEVCGVKSATHIGAVIAGLAKTKKYGQGKEIKITSKSPITMQVDGEPSKEEPCTITFELLNQVNMLYNSGSNNKRRMSV